jgi:hypothetical protein
MNANAHDYVAYPDRIWNAFIFFTKQPTTNNQQPTTKQPTINQPNNQPTTTKIKYQIYI